MCKKRNEKRNRASKRERLQFEFFAEHICESPTLDVQFICFLIVCLSHFGSTALPFFIVF